MFFLERLFKGDKYFPMSTKLIVFSPYVGWRCRKSGKYKSLARSLINSTGLFIPEHRTILKINSASRLGHTVSDPYSFDQDPDPALEAGDHSGSRALMTKNWKKLTAEKNWLKTAIYLSLGLHKVCPSYRRSLQLSKEAIQHLTLQNINFYKFFLLLWVIFCGPVDPDPLAR